MTRSGWRAQILADVSVEGSPRSYDLYLPEGRIEGLIIYIHGGGWEQGSNHRPPGFRSILEGGFALAAVQYRFSDAVGPLEMVRDILDGARSAISECERLEIVVPALFFWGISAGGHLASLSAHHVLAHTAGIELQTAPSAVASWCGPMDLGLLKTLHGVSEENRATINRILKKLCRSHEELLEASPLTYAGPMSPPHLFIHGAEDGLVPPEQSLTMHHKLLAAGVRSECIIIPGGDHAMPPGDSAEIDRTIAFFKSITKEGQQ